MQTLNANERSLIWQSMLDADMAVRYYTHLAHRLELRDRWLGAVVFVLASGAFASALITAGQPVQVVVSLLTVVASAIAVYVRFGDGAGHAAALFRQFALVLADYERLWSRIDETDAEAVRTVCKALSDRVISMSESAARQFGEDRSLAERAQNEVLQSRGLAIQG